MNIIDINNVEIRDCGLDINWNKPKFKLQNKRVFLTYPIKIPKRDLFDFVISNVGEIKYYKISHETYKDEPIDENGNDRFHTHFLLEFTYKPQIYSCDKFDYELDGVNIHPNIKGVYSNFHFKNSIEYLSKEDENAFTNIKINDFDEDSQLNDLFNKIQSHKNWRDVLNDICIRKKVRARLNWTKEVWLARPKQKVICSLKFQDFKPWQKNLYKHLKSDPVDREIIWCWSEGPKTGKSTFKKYLMSKFNVLAIDVQNKQIQMNDIVNIYTDEDIICFDLPYTKSKDLEERIAYYTKYNMTYTTPFLDTLELLSNKGQEFSSVKYTGCKKVIYSHILVFSNCCCDDVRLLLPQRIKPFHASNLSSTEN